MAVHAQLEARRCRTRPLVRLHGRDAEIEVLDGHLDRLRHGQGGVVLIEGATGMGKSRLLREALTRAERLGIRTARAAGDCAADVPMGPLLEAFLAGETPLLDRAALREISALAEPRFWQLQELQGRLERAALERPLVVAFDDLDRADEATLLALRTLSRRLSAHAILWLLTARGGAARQLTTSPAAEPGPAITLGPLDRPAADAIARDVLGAPAEPALLDLAGDVQGQPFLLIELLCGMREEGRVKVRAGAARLAAGGLPQRFRDTVADRLDALSLDARAAVEMAAVLGRRCTAQQVAELLGLSPAALLAPLQEALWAGLLEEQGEMLGFRHELVRQAVSAGLPASVRRALRRQAVAVMLRRGRIA